MQLRSLATSLQNRGQSSKIIVSHVLLQFVHNAATDRDFKIDFQFINNPRQWQFDLLQEAATSWVIVTFRFVPATAKNQVRKRTPIDPAYFYYAFSL